MRDRQLYYGDNLDVLRRKIASDSVDLCYIDPPFNSKRNYFQIYNNQGSEDRAQAQAFVDTWEWGEEAVAGLDYILDLERLHGGLPGTATWTVQTVELIRGLEKVLGRGSLLAYLVHMTQRIVEIHRVLKPTGSFYLHCDPTASHYLKLVCDAVFCGQGGDYQNEIVWKRTSAHNSAVRYGPAHDVIFFYTKSDQYIWNLQYSPYEEQYIKAFFTHQDADGRRWQRTDLTGPGTRQGDSGLPWRDYDPTPRNRHWQPPSYFYDKFEAITGKKLSELPLIDRLEEMDRVGLIHWPAKSGGMPRGKRFLEDAPGIVLQDVWTDVRPMHNMTGEAMGYPTQKPEALLERIIRASSNESDVILDAYCGCGTTVAVAERLKRKWIGIDITYQSIALILKRLEDRYPADWPAIEADILLDGVPRDLASAQALANRKDDKTRKEFEKWAVLTFSKNQARINEKKGADAGIDGIAYFLLDKDSNGKAIFQVKSGASNRATLATLNSDRQREKAEFGFLITMDLPTKAMRDEIAAAGKFRHPLLNREDDRLQVITVAEIIAGKRLDLPMARKDAVKSARAVDNDDRQGALI